MIDLTRTRAAMLAEIDASAKAIANRIPNPSDPAFLASDEASVVVRGQWIEIVPPLHAALAERFADVPPEQFIRDIHRPLKMGIGNAHKRGNRCSPDKQVTVEAVVTRSGAFLEVTDEGDGFDVEGTLRGFRGDQHYFTNKGGGFRAFERASSVVSYADGGRRLLIRFLRESKQPALVLALDEDFMWPVLRKLPLVSKHGGRLESCRARAIEGSRERPPEVRYELDIRTEDGRRRDTVLTGRLLSEAATRREYEVAKRLYKSALKATEGFRVPKPMEVFKRHPRLVLYRLDPGPAPAAPLEDPTTIAAMAAGLRALHGSGVALPDGDDAKQAGARRARARQRVADELTASFPDRVPRWLAFCDQLEARGNTLDGFSPMVPTHGSFDADCVRRGRDRRGQEHRYVYRFDEGRLSHPGFDVGGVLADLGPHDAEARELFLATYLGGPSPPWLRELPFFTAAVLLFRLDRRLHFGPGLAPAELDGHLDRCEESLQRGARQ